MTHVTHVFMIDAIADGFLNELRHIRPSMTEEMANCVACSLVQSRLDYGKSLYTGMLSVTSTNYSGYKTRSLA